ncbi:MAG TPA: hypothetical protein VFE53_05925 [Mucilaginibacter sp.]|nr:hypothetical protein [Mucilaginibacter sp.]
MLICFTGCKQAAYQTPPPASSGSYFPQTYGSTWQYRDSLYGLPTDTFPLKGVKNDIVTFTMTSATTDFNSLICYNADVQSQLDGESTAYYAVLQHKFFLLVSSPPWGLTTMQVMVDTASVGYHWYSNPTLTGLLNGSPVQCINTILEKGISRVVNGVTFTNVIHTGSNFEINIGNNGFHNIAYFDFYLAPGIGLIEKDASYYGYLNETETLMTYTIK